MDTQTYQILIDSSYDEIPREAKHYVNRLVNKASKKPFVSTVLKGCSDVAIKTDDIECLLIGAIAEFDLNRRIGRFLYLKIKIFMLVFSLLTGATIPKLLKKDYCLFLQSVVIASYLVKEGYVNESPYYWDYE
jgi:hypothetical protein